MKQKGPLTSANEAIEGTPMKPKTALQGRLGTAVTAVRILAVLSMTVIAFWNSYSHTVTWFQDHDQEGTAHALAALPEVGLLVALLCLLTEPLDRTGALLVGSLGLGSLGLTLTANLSQASTGTERLAAVVAPAFTVVCFALEARSLVTHLSRPEPVVEPVAAHEPEREPVAEPVSQPESTVSLRLVGATWPEPVDEPDEPTAWDRESVLALIKREGLTTAQAVERTGKSKATINRWKNEAA